MRNDKEDQKSSRSFDSLPQHLWEEIMARLPPRSLVRFMSVSKSWRAHIASLLDDPSFAAKHLRNAASRISRRRRLGLLFCFPTPPPYELSVATYDRLGRWIDYAGFGLKACGQNFQKGTASHRDGLVLVESDNESAVLCNPAMNEWKTLTPRSPIRFSVLCWGLGFDCKAGDYNIVRFDSDLVSDPPSLRANVYSLSTGSWRVYGTATSVAFHLYPLPQGSIFSKGGCYYFAVLSPEYTVISFDPRRGEFGVVPPPDGLKGEDLWNTLAAWKDGLAIISCPQKKTVYKPIEIWAAEDEGGESCAMITWTKKHCIYSGMFWNEVFPYGLWFWTEEELVGHDVFGQSLSYNLRSREVRYLTILGAHETVVLSDSWVIPYFESLVSLQPRNKKRA